MISDKKFIKYFFSLLNKKCTYAVLRNYENLPTKIDSHDIDILIKEDDFQLIKREVFLLFTKFDYKILTLNKTEKMATIVIGKVVDNKLEYLFLDFFLNLSLFGIFLQDSKKVLADRVFNGSVYHVSIVDEFLEKFLYNTLLNHPYPNKYQSTKEKVLSEYYDELLTKTRDIFGYEQVSPSTFDGILGKKYLLYALKSNIKKRPFEQVIYLLKYILFYIKSRIYSNGFSFSITGPDGSGKTTILKGLETNLSNVYREVKLNHFRPTVIPRIAELFKKSGLKKEVDENYSQPHRGNKTGVLSSSFRLGYYIFDYIIGYWIVVKPVLFRRGIVIFDRYFTDIISDSLRSRIHLNYKMIFPFRHLIPAMDYNFIIFVEPALILQRKQELTHEQIDDIYEKLNYICENDKSYTRIENNDVPEIAINTIINFILENQHKKYASYFQ